MTDASGMTGASTAASSEPGGVRARALEAAVRVVAATPEGPVRAAFELSLIATRVRLGDTAAVAELAERPVAARMSVLELVAANQPATPALAELARGVLFQTDRFAHLSDRHLGLWAGMTPAEVGLGETNSADRLRILGRLIGGGTPTTLAGFVALLDRLEHQVEIDGAVVAWCERQPLDLADPLGVAVLARVQSAGARLEAMAAHLYHAPVPSTVVGAWVRVCDEALAAAPPRSRGVHLARAAALIHTAGSDASALSARALTELDALTDPSELARAHRAALRAAAVIGIHAWEPVAEHVARARPYLRDLERFLASRAEVIRTTPRMVRSVADVDRADQALREQGRRLPDRWLELHHHAVIARELASRGRVPELQLARLELLLKDGLPRPVLHVMPEEVVTAMRDAAPDRALRVLDALPSPPQRLVWASALAV